MSVSGDRPISLVALGHTEPVVIRPLPLAPDAEPGRRSRGRGPLLHLLARWQAAALDRELAAGVHEQTSAVLALRARKLTSGRRRKHIAAGLSRALRSARYTGPSFTAAVRPRATELISAQPVVTSLASRLRSPEPVTAQGMAMLGALLTDPGSPLYQPTEPGTLASRLRTAAAALRPR